MATGDLLEAFCPLNCDLPTSSYPTLNFRNNTTLLEFDASTNQNIIFAPGRSLKSYTGNGITIRLLCTMASATSGNVVMIANFEKRSTSDNIDLTSFGIDNSSGAVAVPGTNGLYFIVTITASNSNIDGVSNGDFYRLRIARDASNVSDTASGALQLIAVEMSET